MRWEQYDVAMEEVTGSARVNHEYQGTDLSSFAPALPLSPSFPSPTSLPPYSIDWASTSLRVPSRSSRTTKPLSKSANQFEKKIVSFSKPDSTLPLIPSARKLVTTETEETTLKFLDLEPLYLLSQTRMISCRDLDLPRNLLLNLSMIPTIY